MKFAICNETYRARTFDEVCRDAAECGYDGIEIALSELVDDPTRMDEDAARAAGDTAHRAGLAVVGLHWLLAAPGGMHLTTGDDVVRWRTVRYLQHLARLCAAMRGGVLVLGSPKQRELPPGESYDRGFERAAEACRAVADTAHPLGVTLALEPLAPAYTNFLTTADETVRLIEAVDHPGCRLHLDVFAMTAEEDPIDAVIARCGAHLAHFHANDDNMGGPGSGGIDYAPIVRALRGIGYDGYVSVEVFDYEPDGPTIARESLAFLRRAFG